MASYKNPAGEVKSTIVMLASYFRLPGETLMQFNNGCKPLTEEEKTELADGAAKELGWQKVG